ncbi:MAG: histidinol-phosphate transaminase [Gammaproteobacteria bacterium]
MKNEWQELSARLLRPGLRETAAYHVQEYRGLLKLDAMESPFGWPPELRAELAARIEHIEINRYPDPRAEGLRELLKQVFRVPDRWDVMLGNGSDELIQILMLALAGPDLRVMSTGPGFVMFRVIAGWLGIPFEEVPLAEDFALDVDAMRAVLADGRPRLVFLACPNNPTGNLFDAASLESVLDAARGSALVVIDEAYWAFASREHIDWLDRYPNLLLMRTLSKLGLAGLRLGFLVGHPDWLRELDKLRLPYNVGCLHQAAGEVALRHFGLLRAQTRQIVEERGRLYARLVVDARLQVWPSEANFLLVRPLAAGARAVHAAMIRHGVLVKCFDGAHPQLANCLRLTVGSGADNAAMCEALEAALAEVV